MQPIVLASSSKYRQELLKKLQIDFICDSSNIDESRQANESPSALAVRLAREKTQAVAKRHSNHLIIGSDQVATCGNSLLGKPGSPEKAFQQLKSQSGQIVTFFTGVCVVNSRSGDTLTDLDICKVHFRNLTDSQIQRYLAVEQAFDCAGSFMSEGYGITLFSKIEGDDPNALIGLPLIKLIKLLNQCDLTIP